MGKGEEVYENLAVLARREGADVVYMKTADWVEAGELTLTCLYAGEDFGGKDRNSHSLVLCGDYKGFHMLFTGDMGEGQERSLVRLAEQEETLQDIHLNHAQILKTAHHGSGTSSSEVFLNRLRIQLAVVSYGKENAYGHPSPETMSRLKEQGIVINLPYGSLSAMMTRVSEERDMLSVVRMGLSPLGRIMAVTFTLPLVKLFGDNQAAWIKTMSIWAAAALILLIICFLKCEETVVIEAQKKAEKGSVLKGIKTLVTNQYFWAVLVLWMLQSVSFGISGTILPYYCKYIFGNDTWMYSALYLTETLVLVGCIFLCAPLIRKCGKRNVALAGAFIALIGQLLFFINPMNFAWMVMSCVLRAIGLAPLNAAVFGMIGDVVEFGQWKTHIRQESLIFAGGSIGTKVGSGVASAAMTGFLSLAGYISSSTGTVEQPQQALDMIINIYKAGPLIVAVMAVITLSLYKLDKKYPAIMEELIEREARGEL